MAFCLHWFGIVFVVWVCTCMTLGVLCKFLPRGCLLCRFHRRA